MFHNFLFCMSLAGSVVMIFYILTYPIAKRFFSLAWSYSMLKVSIMFFLVPFSVFQYEIKRELYETFPFLLDKIKVYTKVNTKYAFVTNGNVRYTSLYLKIIYVLAFVFCFVGILIISFHFLKYFKAKRIYLHYSDTPVSEEQKRIFEEIKIQLKIHRKIQFRCSEYCNSPITIGVIFPVIIVPPIQERIREELYRSMIMHELIHIKHHDILIKFLGILIVAIHWFNPFSYILLYEISNISEMYCDSVVLEGKGEQYRKAYGELLLELASVSDVTSNKYIIHVLGNGKMKRRILEMKITRKNKMIASFIVMGLICMLGGSTTFAYESPQDIRFEEKVEGFAQDSDILFLENEQEMEEIFFEKIFIDGNNNVYEIKGERDRVICSHKYVSGTTMVHTKNNSGGCTARYYEAKRCSICGSVITENEIKTVTYKKCPH